MLEKSDCLASAIMPLTSSLVVQRNTRSTLISEEKGSRNPTIAQVNHRYNSSLFIVVNKHEHVIGINNTNVTLVTCPKVHVR